MASWVDEYLAPAATFLADGFPTPMYKPSVATRRQLPLVADLGDCRVVEDEDAMYQFVDGRWYQLVGVAE